MKPVVITVVVLALFAAGVGGAYYFVSQTVESNSTNETQPAAAPANSESSQHGKSIEIPKDATLCAIHNVPEVVCPFCSPSLIEERGHCGAHDVAEALCTRCSPVLIAAFKVERDWCAEHGLPESQCTICSGGEAPSDATASAGMCEKHNIPITMCAFCDPSLVESLGWCGGHDVPEAFCTRCNSTLIAAFKVEGDWCEEHGLPESQCQICNPSDG